MGRNSEHENMENEEWRDIPNYEGWYQVSNLGRVRSLDRVVKDKSGVLKKLSCKILSQALGSRYRRVSLYKDGKAKVLGVHQLVAMAFLSHVPCGFELVVNHINFNGTDNRLENLEIVSHRDNTNKKHLKSSSKYIGVSWRNRDKKWRSQIRVNGKTVNLGSYDNELDAHEAYQAALKEIQSGAEISFKPKKKSSKYKGVFWNKKSKRWYSYILLNGKQKYIGGYVNELDAHYAYQKELLLIQTNLLSLQYE